MVQPTMNLNDLPEALRHTMLIELAHVFCRRLGRPRANDIEMAGFSDLTDLLLRGWILREPGRYSIGYQPGEPVIREMWLLDPMLCSALRLPPPLVSRIPDVDDATGPVPSIEPEQSRRDGWTAAPEAATLAPCKH